MAADYGGNGIDSDDIGRILRPFFKYAPNGCSPGVKPSRVPPMKPPIYTTLVIVGTHHLPRSTTALSPLSPPHHSVLRRIRPRPITSSLLAYDGGDDRNNDRPYFAQDSYYYDDANSATAPGGDRYFKSQAVVERSSSSFDERWGISDTDARVLESILREGKMDSNDMGEARRLLEGPRRMEVEIIDSDDSGDVSSSPSSVRDRAQKRINERDKNNYNSQFMGAVSDNAFWNSLKAKAVEILDSVSIYIENRIERDAGILAAVGIFAVDRIRRDVGRALPAAGRAARTLLLSSNSAYAEQLVDRPMFALPSERSEAENRGSLYNNDGSTPADEIRKVVAAIRDILRDAPPSSSSSSTSRRRAVRSFAPAGTSQMAERQRLAYDSRKKTVLRREREGIDRKFSRAIGSVTDATWEFQREMQTDVGREAGYRSLGARKALAVGAARLLEAGRESSRRLLSSNGDRRRNNLLGSASTRSSIDTSPVEEEEIIAKVMVETGMDRYATDGLLSPKSFYEEKQRLIASLESCLSQPSETWLTKDVVAQAVRSGISLDRSELRDAIASMVTFRDQLQYEIEEIVNDRIDLTVDYVQKDLRRMKQMVDSVASLAITAAGATAAGMLKEELEGFVLSDSLDDIIDIELERMEQLLADMVVKVEEDMQWSWTQRYEEVVIEPAVASKRKASDRKTRHNRGYFTEVEVVLTPARASFSQKNTLDQDGQDPSSRVEVVSDSEYSEYEQQFKYAQINFFEEEVDANNVNQENPALDFFLRVVDAVFFIGEKLFFVILPDLLAVSTRATSIYDEAHKRQSSDGWKPLKNVKKGR